MKRTTANARQGLTLIEMLVATAVTLMLIAALAQVFQVVGTNVAGNRATVEMAGQMRRVTSRLQQDLEGLTTRTLSWAMPDAGGGYLEYIEAGANDRTISLGQTGFGDYDDVLMFTSRSQSAPFVGNQRVGAGSTRSVAIRESPLAEIVWWATLNDLNSNGSVDFDQREDFNLYRRVFLIRPDLNTAFDSVVGNYVGLLEHDPSGPTSPPAPRFTFDISNQTELQELVVALRNWYNENDLSGRFVAKSVGGTSFTFHFVANTLEDLTRRENRVAHLPVVVSDPSTPGALMAVPRTGSSAAVFPYPLDRNGRSGTSLPTVRIRSASNPFSEPGLIKSNAYQGDDVMMSQMIAFDVRAFDPTAAISAHPGEDGAWGWLGTDDDGQNGVDDPGEAGWPGTDDEALIPGDPGYGFVPVSMGGVQIASSPNRFIRPIGRGAFVDLGYAGMYGYNTLTANANFNSHFAANMQARSQLNLRTWDTWPFSYETDGLDQDGDGEASSPFVTRTSPTTASGLLIFPAGFGLRYADGVDNNPPGAPAIGLVDENIDEGTDGVDTPTRFPPPSGPIQQNNGIDDASERETSPPYLRPLRGLQIRVRMIEHDSRQVRQGAVEVSFTPE